jgi:hypothetical protein
MNLEKIGSVGSFAYCPGPRSMFTLLEDDHNQKYFPQGVLDEKLVSISFQAIADVCSCTSDFVQTVLQSIRDELVEIVTAKGRAVSLNLIIGSLSVNQSGQVSFKSLTIEQVAR